VWELFGKADSQWLSPREFWLRSRSRPGDVSNEGKRGQTKWRPMEGGVSREKVPAEKRVLKIGYNGTKEPGKCQCWCVLQSRGFAPKNRQTTCIEWFNGQVQAGGRKGNTRTTKEVVRLSLGMHSPYWRWSTLLVEE